MGLREAKRYLISLADDGLSNPDSYRQYYDVLFYVRSGSKIGYAALHQVANLQPNGTLLRVSGPSFEVDNNPPSTLIENILVRDKSRIL